MSLILASASVRRKDLMQKAGYEFEVVTSKIDEAEFPTDNIEPVEYAKKLALAKAKDVAERHRGSLVIGADTIADFGGKIIGKPADKNDAERITRMLFSSPHKVITGVALIRLADGIELVDSDTTVVYPRRMTEKQIAAHIKDGNWRGKAGAYAIQETGDEFVERVEGSLTNVMGLPMELLEDMLNSIAK
jgi:septum formation protein